MAKTNRLGREPQFGDMSFSMRGTPTAQQFSPAPTVMPGMPAAQGRQEGANALAGLGIPSKAEYIKQRLLEVAGTPMVKPRETVQQWNRDYMALEARAQQQQNFQTTRGDTADHRRTTGKRAQDELDWKMGGSIPEDRGGALDYEADLKRVGRDPTRPSAQFVALVKDIRKQNPRLSHEEATARASMAMSRLRPGDEGGDPLTGPVLQKMLAEEVGKPSVDRPGLFTGDDYNSRQEALIRRQELAQSVVEQRLQQELGSGAAIPQDEQTAAPSPTKKRRRGQQTFKPDYGKAAATTQPVRRLIQMPDGTEQTIPQEQLEDFLATVPGAKLLK